MREDRILSQKTVLTGGKPYSIGFPVYLAPKELHRFPKTREGKTLSETVLTGGKPYSIGFPVYLASKELHRFLILCLVGALDK
jgi:hypothetical protein